MAITEIKDTAKDKEVVNNIEKDELKEMFKNKEKTPRDIALELINSNLRDLSLEKIGKIKFVYSDGEDNLEDSIILTEKEILSAGLDPKDIGIELVEKSKISKKDISEADIQEEINLTDMRNTKDMINRILNRAKDMGENQ